MRSFLKIKSSRNGEITLSFNYEGKSCHSHECFTSQICLLTLFAKIKFSRKFPNLQYAPTTHPSIGFHSISNYKHSRFSPTAITAGPSLPPPTSKPAAPSFHRQTANTAGSKFTFFYCKTITDSTLTQTYCKTSSLLPLHLLQVQQAPTTSPSPQQA